MIAQYRTAQDALRSLQRRKQLIYSMTCKTRKYLQCDYSPSPPLPITTLEPLVLRPGSSAARLSSHGAWGLLRAVDISLHATYTEHAETKLSSYVIDILNLANVDLISALDDYGPSLQYRSPTVHAHVIKRGAEEIATKYPLLALAAWLVTTLPYNEADHPHRNELYQAL